MKKDAVTIVHALNPPSGTDDILFIVYDQN